MIVISMHWRNFVWKLEGDILDICIPCQDAALEARAQRIKFKCSTHLEVMQSLRKENRGRKQGPLSKKTVCGSLKFKNMS